MIIKQVDFSLIINDLRLDYWNVRILCCYQHHHRYLAFIIYEQRIAVVYNMQTVSNASD